MFVYRDYNRTEDDDFKLNVEPQLKGSNVPLEAVPFHDYDDDNEKGILTPYIFGWKIQQRYE